MRWIGERAQAHAPHAPARRWFFSFVILFGGGCESPLTAVDLWVPPKSIPAAMPGGDGAPAREIQSGNHTQVKLAGANNEVIGFPFFLRADAARIPTPRFQVRPFQSDAGTLGASAVQIWRLHPVSVARWPGWHIRAIPPGQRETHPLDVLVPLSAPRGGMPEALQPGEIYHFWVDLTIPKGTAGGSYQTEIELAAGATILGRVTVSVEVWPFSLPDETPCPFVVELDHRSLFEHHFRHENALYHPSLDDWRADERGDELDELLQSTLRMLQGHRLTPILSRLSPLVKIRADDTLIVDWSQYDTVVRPLLSGEAFRNRLPLRLWPIPDNPLLAEPTTSPSLPGDSFGDLAPAFFVECAEHFDRAGWLDRSFVRVEAERPARVETPAAYDQLMHLIRAADSRIAILVPRCPQDLRPYGAMHYSDPLPPKMVDIWLSPAQYFDPEAMESRRAAEEKTWIVVDRPPFSGTTNIAARPTDVRVLARQVDALGAEAAFVGSANRWPAAAAPTPDECIRYDAGVLLYPGGPFGLNEPVPSMRLKLLRQSLQDAAYDALLTQHGLDHVARTVRQSLCPYAGVDAYRTNFADGRAIGWPDDPATFELARHIMARELLASTHERGPQSRSEELVRTAAWRQLILATRTLRVHFDGARVRLTEPQSLAAFEVSLVFTAENRTRKPALAEVRFGELPEGWSMIPDEEASVEIAPDAYRRFRLSAWANTMSPTPDGLLQLPVELTTNDGDLRRFSARVSFVSARSASAPFTIDGDLSDWPLGATNVASDFRLISGTRENRPDATDVRPRRATYGFVARDEEFLYFAANCEMDAGLTEAPVRRNLVTYEDMVPVGEELIEILLDPYNTGTRSPADLFHIVVKFNGGCLAERGIDLEPPCGSRQPWAADLEVATRVFADRWTAELRIPLAAFGPVSTQQAVWGFNLTRFDHANQEFSTWSAAVRNAYDPLSLGNLYLP